MNKLISAKTTQTSVHAFLRVFLNGITNTFKNVNQRTLSTMSTTLVLFALLSACGGGGGGGGSTDGGGGGDTTTPILATTPTLSVLVSNLSVIEDFTTAQLVATATNATSISITVSTTGVVSVNATANSVNVSSIPNASGRTTLTMTAINGSLRSTAQVVVTVTEVNDPPLLTVSTTALTLLEDFATVLIASTRSDAEGHSLAFAVTQSNPGVVTITESTSGFDISSIANAHGVTTITFTVSDGQTNTLARVGITVLPVNDPPTLSVSTNRITTIGGFTPITINTTANDVEEGDLSFTVTQSTNGVVNVTTSTNAIVLNAIPGVSGATTLTVIAANSSGITVTQTIAITVNIVTSAVPVLVISTNLIRVQEDFNASLVLRTTATDSDGDTITLSVSSTTRFVDAVISTPVNGMSTLTNVITLTAVANANGTATLTIIATDMGGQSMTSELVMALMSVNDTPTLTIPTATLTLSEDFEGVRTIATIVNVDGDTLTINVADSNTGVVNVTTSASGIQVAHILNASGQTTINMTVSDGLLSSTAQVVVRVEAVNDPPTLTVSTTALTLVEDFNDSVLIRSTRTDIDSNTLTLTVTESTTGVVTVTTSAAGVHLASRLNAFGQTTLTITVNDGTTNTSTQVAITVTAVNDTPTFTIPTGTIIVLEDFMGVSTIATIADVEGDTLTITVIESNTGVITVSTSDSGVQLTSRLNASGQTTLTIQASDGRLHSTARISVEVTPVNDTPTISISTTSLTFFEDFSLPSIINVSSADIDGDTLTISVTESTPGVITVTTTDSSVRLASRLNTIGQTILTISVSDGRLSASTQVSVTVTLINDPPTLTLSANPLILNEDFSGFSTVATAIDFDGDPLTISVVEASTPLVNVTTSASSVRVSSIKDVNGQTTLTISATDGRFSVTTQVVVIVRAINDPPTITASLRDVTFPEDFTLRFPITITSNDIEGDTLSSITVTASNPGVVDVIIPSNTEIQIRSILNANGQTTLTISRNDGNSTASVQVVVTVIGSNDPPTLDVSTNNISTSGGFSAITIHTTASDVEDGILSFSVQASTTTIIRVTTSANAIVLSPIDGASGRTTLTVSVVDDSGLTITQTIAVNVAILSSTPPTLMVSTQFITIQEDFRTSVVIRTTATDADGHSITLSLSSSSLLVNAVPSTPLNALSTLSNTISLTSIAHLNGTTTLTVRATDVGGQSTSTEIVVVVNSVNDTPTLTIPSATLTLSEDFTSTPTLATAVNVDDDTLTFSVIELSTGVITVTTSASGVHVSSIANANGQSTMFITVSDGTLSESAQVVVTVTAVNDTPTLTIPATAIIVAEDFAIASTIATALDTESDPLTFSVIESITGVVTVTTSASSVHVSSIADVNGQTTLTVSVSDGFLSSTAQVVVVVTAVNDPPSLSVSTTALTFTEDFATTALITVTRADIENNTLTLSVIESTTGVVRVSTSDSGVHVASRANANGQTTLTIAVSDGRLRSTTQVAVTVIAVNDTPTLSISMTALILIEDFMTTSFISVSSNDVDNDTLTLSVIESPTGVVRVSTSDSGVHVASRANAHGQTTLSIAISDGRLRSTAQLLVTVIAVNDTPTLTVSTNIISVIEGFSTITIHTTASDIEDQTTTFSVQQSISGLVSVTTSANAIFINPIADSTGTTILTVRTTDNGGKMAMQTITVNVLPMPPFAPVLVISTNRITVQEDFTGSIVIRTTATDANGDTITLSLSSTSRFVNAVISTPISDISTFTNMITLTAIDNANGTTTLTVFATDSDGLSSAQQLVVAIIPVSDAIPFTLATSVVTMSAPGDQLERNVHSINISNMSGDSLRAQFQVISSGAALFSANPAPEVSFTTNALMTATTLTSTTHTAQLYFSIAPDQFGTATLTVQLTNLVASEMSQQTMVVQVNSVNVPAVITQASQNVENLFVHGGHLYANSVIATPTVAGFLAQSSALGGHLINLDTVEEFTFMRESTASGLILHLAWFGMVLPQVDFPGELYWITNNSTISYGFVSTSVNTTATVTVYPGNYRLTWDEGGGLIANRGRFGSATTANWTVYSGDSFNRFFLLGDRGDPTSRRALYEFPQGLAPASNQSMSVLANSTTRLRFTGYDLNRDMIRTASWSAVDPNGGTARFENVYQSTGVQTVDMVYTAPATYNGQTTVVVSLQVNGLNTTTAITFTVDTPPSIALSTHTLVLNEDFGTFVIGTTVTDQGVSGALPFTVLASSTRVMTITTSANTIQLTAVPHAYGRVTLSVQTTDSASQTTSTQVVVTVQAVNDTPTLTISTNNIATIGGFMPISIRTTVTDVEDVNLPFTVQASATGVVTISTSNNTIVLNSVMGGSGQTTLTVTVVDSSNVTVVQTIVVNVFVSGSTTPVLTVSTNLISLQEDFTASVFIQTIASDADGDTLTLSVSSSRALVNALVSTQGISLSAVKDQFGTTTLIVRATDAGGVFDSTQIVVVVDAVNDPPTLTVSSSTVTIVTDPITVNVTASDIEDSTLSFSVSTGQGVVSTIFTTSSLTISRLGINASQVLLTLSATDIGGLTTSTIVTVLPTPMFIVTTGIKTLDFAWSAAPATSHYQLRSNPDGNSGIVDLSTTGMVVSPNSTNIRQTTAQGLVSLHRYIPRVVNPLYSVYPCNSVSCGASIGNMATLTRAQLNSMIGRLQANNRDPSDQFGDSISLSGDGNTLAVGAPNERSASTGVNGVQSDNSALQAGAVYLFSRNGGVWSQQAYIKASNTAPGALFGFSVSLSRDGHTLAVGAESEAGSSTGINGLQTNTNSSRAGAVYLFRFSGGEWTQQAYIKASNTDSNDRFGGTVSLSSDGNTLVAGAKNEDNLIAGVNNGGQSSNSATNVGAVYVFRFNNGVWTQQAYIKASNPGDNDMFGGSTSLSADGNTLAVGATGEGNQSTGINNVGQSNNDAAGSGAVYLFRFNNGDWTQEAYIKATKVRASDNFGHSVSLSTNGNTIAVGAPNEDGSSAGVNGVQNNSGSNTGAVYVFRYSLTSSAWTQQAYIKTLNLSNGDNFGYAVSLSADGNMLAAGAISERGSATGIGGADDNSIIVAGAAYSFEFNNGTWSQRAYIKATESTIAAQFGRSVSLSSSGGTLAVSSYFTSRIGAVYLY